MSGLDQLKLLDEDYFTEQPGTSEDEDDIDNIPLSIISDVQVSATDWTTETIVGQINKGNIILNPKFQRRDAWDANRKSSFIELLILNIPVPQIVLAEQRKNKGTYLVIDGKQRLLTLRQFSAKKADTDFKQLKLSGKGIIPHLRGKSHVDFQDDPLLRDELNEFDNRTIRTVVIRNWQSEDFLFEVFLRLNTGSVKLSPQELRQALHPGKFLDFVDEKSGESIAMRKILNISKPDFRMRDAELMIRYLAFKNNIAKYSGNLKHFLDETCQELNKYWNLREKNILDQTVEFENAFEFTTKVFSLENSFRKWSKSSYERRFNRAIFDIMMYYFSDPKIRAASDTHTNQIEKKYKQLCDFDTEFVNSIERTTKSTEATFYRMDTWGLCLSKIIGIDIPKIRTS